MRWQPGMNLSGLLNACNEMLAEPLPFEWSNQTPRFLLIFTGLYAVIVLAASSEHRNTRPGEEHGSARWGNAKELNRRYRDTQGPNLLMTRNIRIGVDGYKHKHNTNVLVVGGSGAGKTRTYAVPNVLEAGCSMVITDPKGEILRKTGGFLKRAGYEVRVFDLLNPDASFCYNPFRYVRDDKEVLQLITNLIQNTTPPHAQSSDPFWEKSETALLQALMLYLLHEAPPEEQNFGMVMELLGSAQVKEEDENFESPLDILFERLAMRDPESIAVKQYGIYKQAAGKTAKSILVSVGVRLAAFNLPQIARLTMTDELHLDDLGERRVALFCCIPDSDKSLNYLVGMVYTQLIQTLFYQADRVHRGRLPVPVHCLMDEFPNISLPKDSFQSALATMRSRGIFCSIIVQNIAQLKSMYKDSWESLVGLCDEFLYLGGNEQGTHKYVSELIGKETVETTSRSLSRGRSGSSSTSHQQTARDLMTPDEVRLLSNDKALLFVRGERPVMDWKYNLLRHPNIRFTEDGGAPPYDYTVAPDAHEDLVGNAENYELLDMDDFLPAAEQPKPMFTYPRRDAHASQQD
nr:type IV secretory system conjugative DNA transfer family protein [uncultured Gemmiger sp.]